MPGRVSGNSRGYRAIMSASDSPQPEPEPEQSSADQPTGRESETKPEDWPTWWLRFGVAEACERTPRLHDGLKALRNTTYVALALVAMIHTAAASAGLVTADPVVAPYAAGAVGVFASVLWAHWPVSVGMGALLSDAPKYRTAAHADYYLAHAKKIYDKGAKQLTRRTRGVQVALISVLVQAAGAGLLLLDKGITTP